MDRCGYASAVVSSRTAQAVAVRTLGLRDALDFEIFQAARQSNVLVMIKDRDFINLLDQHGPPPQIIWLRIGNSSNQALQKTLSAALAPALDLSTKQGEAHSSTTAAMLKGSGFRVKPQIETKTGIDGFQLCRGDLAKPLPDSLFINGSNLIHQSG